MTDSPIIYVTAPDIPPDMTIAEYRRARPLRSTWWRRILVGRA
jgi:hypothetical protein